MSKEKNSISLKRIIGGIIQALVEAKRLGDLESARLIEVYKNEKTLSSSSIPAFIISDTEIELRFSIEGVQEEKTKTGEIPDVKVNISPESLTGLEAYHVSLLKLKFSPVTLRVFEESESK